jgi:hypothetical protein
MYVFTRSAHVRPGHLMDLMTWAVKITEKVNQISEVPATLWTPFGSPSVGSLTWVAMFDDLAVLEGTDAKLMADSEYLAMVDEGMAFATDSPIDDALWQVVYANPDAAAAQPQYINLVNGLLAPGHAARGIELGVEIAQRAERITGRPTSFSVAETGPYGAVEWVGLADSVEQVQAARQALNADLEFAQLLDSEASTAYQPEATQAIHRRIA